MRNFGVQNFRIFTVDPFWIVMDAKFLHADKEDSNQTLQKHKLI